MQQIAFDKDTRAAVVARIREYFVREMDTPIGELPAEMLLGFFTESIGPYYYNQGLADAQAVFAGSLDEINDRIYALERREARVR